MGRVRRIVSIVMILALAITLMPVNANAAVKLNVTEKTIGVGESVVLKVEGTTKKITWKSSNKKVATVTKQGKVTGKKVGKASISAKIGKKTIKCRITVQSGEAIRPEFKAAMDRIEAFYDRFLELEKNRENMSDLEALASLLNMAEKAMSVKKELSQWEAAEKNAAEKLYYQQVIERITEKASAVIGFTG